MTDPEKLRLDAHICEHCYYSGKDLNEKIPSKCDYCGKEIDSGRLCLEHAISNDRCTNCGLPT